MKLGIICAMEEELRTLVENLDQASKITRHGYVFHTGSIGRHEVVLVQSGIGKVMSAMAVTLLVEVFSVDGIINTGSAGAVNHELKIGDVVVADRLAYHDVDVTAFGYAFGQMAQQPLYFESSKYFVSELKKAIENPVVGLITSSDSFISSDSRIAEIKNHFPDVLAVEMEGASIAQAATALKKPFVIIRAMSDTASHDANVKFDEFIIEAGRKSAQTLMNFLNNMK
ncbi:5'-methylthioadenosine/adenosylhomocysteine nucleosidase [Lactococcus formosensis]|jgi:5''-methylthioadenosine/S-adenosylhomocysteine nucleosidase|uniref:adenosylhomocysteine nucleosidase n=1 Tax=Lactococcus formosensis TaxID=1281486 RepID=A0A9Q8Y105_9LACT|nr:5'-methylthioadenosine/adenosylhomocysteine nucleosidase [Lactococcus formosensis]NHI68135.1 5'-methylthioadenosine/adenosylhomocysteine nucleosidase [Lactococcus garvieae]MCH1723903.1 5'-methylthioadenosine/adenosylhomocysteine nucleosidase [Lactococcus formosensis]MCO7181018.1 5'-methylthioadenosine/adenosylhomocysteine nucleosidase [Lactococcus formosensis]MDG6112147.1 5'-methylthioadenosine/adenosylhomocysteine nucleosidase [Lactococcus formosensis]MDG6114258.1 5'-methylthioadenosine/ad